MRRPTRSLALLIATLVVPVWSGAQTVRGQKTDAALDTTRSRLDSMMSAREWRETGMSKLSAAERAALERWLARRESAASRVTSARPAEPAETGRVVLRESGALPTVGSIVGVSSVLSGGSYIVLADGTMWEVWTSDLVATTQWKAGDQLVVRTQPAPPAEWFTLRLENGRTRTIASVRYAGTTGPSRVSIGESSPGETVFRSHSSLQFVAPVYVPVPAYTYPTPSYQYYPYPYYDGFLTRPRHADRRDNDWLRRRGDYDGPRQPAPQQRNIGVRPRNPLPAAPTVSQPPRLLPPPRVKQ